MRVAAIDCGTNSLRLLIADLPAGGGPGTELARRMEIVRLGEGVDRDGRLRPAALARTRQALTAYAAEIADLGAERVRMVATSAARDATNADAFTGLVEEVLGIVPEVVSGDEEARLTYLGAVRGAPPAASGRYLVVDIGGGSTELVVGAETVEAARSVDIGCVRMTERYLAGDPPTAAEVAAAEATITGAVDEALRAVDGGGDRDLIGVAGSVTTVAAIALELPAYESARIHLSRIGYPRVAAVTGDLLRMTRAQRRALSVMHPGRADVIAAGALILRITMERAGADVVLASEHDILDGIAVSLSDS